MRRPGWIVSRDAIIESVWGFEFPDASNLVLQMVRWIENDIAPETITAGPLTVPKYDQTRRDDDVEWAGDYLSRS